MASPLEGFDPTGAGARADESDRRRARTEVRRPRANGDGEEPRARRNDPASSRNAFRPSSDDSFFSRPYEPSAAAVAAQPDVTDNNAAAFGRGRPAPKRQLAALLGGVPRKS